MLLEAKKLTKEYRRGNISFKAVNNVDLSISSGAFVSIIGRSGSGKSTLLNMLASLVTPTSGSIEVEGQNILSIKDKETSLYRNTKIGYIPQGHSTLSNLSVLDNVKLPYFFFQREGNISERALHLLEQVGIPHLAKLYPKQISGGELRRVSIARALINNPSILIADEPTSDLDNQTTIDIMKLFSQISQNGTAILMVTHELDTVDYGNSVYVMDSGTLTKRDKYSRESLLMNQLG